MALGAAMLGIAALVWASWAVLPTRQVLVDYDSGRVKSSKAFGFVILGDVETQDGAFGTWPLPSGKPSLTGTADWHVAMSFRGTSRVSPTFAAGSVVGDVRTLGSIFPGMRKGEASQAKLSYLRALNDGGPSAARKVMQQVLDDWSKGVAGVPPTP